MRASLILTILLLLSAFSFAEANVTALMEPYLYPEEPYWAEQFTFEGNDYVAVRVDGDYAMIFVNLTGEFSLMNNTEEIHRVLREWKISVLNIGERIDTIATHVVNFNESRMPFERQCKQYTGLIIIDAQGEDVAKPCYYNASALQPVESCLLAFRTIPLCLNALANNLPAIYSILYFKNATADLSSNLSSILSTLEDARTLDPHAATTAASQLENIQEARDRIAGNDLFNAYGFCYPVEFNDTALNSAINSLSAVKDELEYIAGLEQVAEHIVQFTNERAGFALQEQFYEQLLVNATSELNSVRERVNSALELVDDPFTRETLDTAEYAYYLLSSAINDKDYLAADNAHHDFTVAISNAENAADMLEKRVEDAKGQLNACTESVYVVEEVDDQGEYLETTAELLVSMTELEEEFNNTPMSITDLASLEAEIDGACEYTGELLVIFKEELFSTELQSIDDNLENARNASQALGIELNESTVEDLLEQANAALQVGRYEQASGFYAAALEKSEELLERIEEEAEEAAEEPPANKTRGFEFPEVTKELFYVVLFIGFVMALLFILLLIALFLFFRSRKAKEPKKKG
ncbi:hypothetical protein DRN67_02320 [Candidatus Micrarchaeota archaeon]|nr:MAG: hypothetical protein DRN67_02320 [Candidatus Micrarchaeota archaeon]